MSERSYNVVGLGKVRKARERDLHKAVAEENAVKFGRTKAQKVLEATQSEQARKMLDSNRIEEE